MDKVINWKCPDCDYLNHDGQDDELGPFINVTCSGCGKAHDIDTLPAFGQPVPRP